MRIAPSNSRNSTNNSNKTIEKIVVKICDQNGNCEEKTSANPVSPGAAVVIREAIDTINNNPLDPKVKHTATCIVTYSDGNVVNCPVNSATPGDTLQFKLEATNAGVTGAVTSQRQLADADKNGAINALDFALCVTRHGQTGANLVCDVDESDAINALDLSIVLAHFNEKI